MPAIQVIQVRRGTAAQWSSSDPVLAAGEIGYESDTGFYKIGDGVTAWGLLQYGGIRGLAGASVLENYGDGSDGDLVISSGTTSLTRDFYYNNVTITGTASIITNGWRLFVKGVLDVSNAPTGAIQFNPNLS